MPKYEVLSQEIADRIAEAKRTGIHPNMAFDDAQVVRRRNIARDNATIWRPTFVHDIDKIIKGYRNDTDLEYERIQAEWNYKHSGYETELWRAESDFCGISSTKARGYIESGENLEGILPEKVISFINNH